MQKGRQQTANRVMTTNSALHVPQAGVAFIRKGGFVLLQRRIHYVYAA